MLPKDKQGVVDPSLKVYGTTNLRIADLSVYPLHVASHTQSMWSSLTILTWRWPTYLLIVALAYAVGEKGELQLNTINTVLDEKFSAVADIITGKSRIWTWKLSVTVPLKKIRIEKQRANCQIVLVKMSVYVVNANNCDEWWGWSE